jgi:two-component system chemotaxis response regulator CheB
MDPLARNIVVVGASAGGTEALCRLLGGIPAGLPSAILVVQHIPSHVASSLHEVLARVTPLRVVVARSGQPLEAGTVYVAPADRHLMLQPDGVRVTRGPKECRARPAVDVLFRSAASNYGPRVIGVILSGALDDGTAGLWAVKDQGGLALVQDPAEAAHDSMPRSAMQHVEVDLVGTLERLAEEISRCAAMPIGPWRPKVEHHEVENLIAMSGRGMQAGVMELGLVSKYTCPDCHGVLVQIEEGPIVRFRCHTGHAFTLSTLMAEVNASIDIGIWETLRAVEERVMLLRQMADIADAAGESDHAALCRRQADDAEARLDPPRDLVGAQSRLRRSRPGRVGSSSELERQAETRAPHQVVCELGPERQRGDFREEQRRDDAQVQQRNGRRTRQGPWQHVPAWQQGSEQQCPEE